MTIILQHQFWDLKVHDEGFSVSLSFNDNVENLYIPFSAIINFVDPSVKFGLQFESDFDITQEKTEPELLPVVTKKRKSNKNNKSATATSSNVVQLDAFRNKH